MTSGKYDPVRDDRLPSVFVQLPPEPTKPEAEKPQAPKSKDAFSSRLIGILNADVR